MNEHKKFSLFKKEKFIKKDPESSKISSLMAGISVNTKKSPAFQRGYKYDHQKIRS